MSVMLAVTHLIDISEDLSETLIWVAFIIAGGLVLGGRS